MRLKRLDIVGFKSFMDRTVIQFDKGITGVVGPNGCGKSNIVDAIRWVLGEQSPKHLRGSSMSDVIFNGSQSRPPLGMAEVTLTFYNDDPEEVPARYRTFREIAVTRRLFRTGESEYLVNKTACRLMDITDLFLGTGVGTKAYSIIEQGRIGIIVSAKAEDRRTLIEEAAGITRYKAKKKAAERKMEHTRANLLRVGDLVGELGRRLESLKRQARKAERYKALKAELREIELHLVTHRWLEVRTLRTLLARRLAAAAEDIARTAGEIEALEADLRRRRGRLAEEEARLAEVQNRATEAEGQAKVHEERVSGLVRERESLDARTREARDEAEALEARLAALAGEHATAVEALGELEQLIKGDEAVLAERTTDAEAATAEVARLTGLLEAERAGALEGVRAVSQRNSHLQALDRQRQEVEARIAKAADEIAAVAARIAEQRAEREALVATVDDRRQLQLRLEADRAAQAESLKACRAELAEARGSVAEHKDTLAGRKSRLESLRTILRNYEGYEKGVRSVMLEREAIDGVEPEAILGLVADVVHADARCEAAVEAVLDARLQYVLVQDGATARRLATWLAEAKGGRSTFVAVDDLRPAPDGAETARSLAGRPGVVGAALDLVESDHEAVVRRLLGDVVVVEDLEVASALSAEAPGLTFVTLAGEVLDRAAVLTGGTREGAGTGLLETRREVSELEAEVEALTRTLEVEGEGLGRLEAREASLDTGLTELTQDSHTEQLGLVAQETELERLADVLSGLRERATALEADRAEDEGRLEANAADAERTRAALAAAESDQATRKARAEALEAEIATARETEQARHGEVTRLRVKAAADVERAGALAKERERLESARDEAKGRLAGLEALVEGSGASFEAIAGRMAEGEDAARRLVAEAERLRTEIARARETVHAADAQIQADEDRLGALRADHQAASENRGSLAVEDRELELELAHLEDGVAERHATSLAEALSVWHLASPPTEDDHDRLGALRAKVDRMGEVNLTAIGEFTTLSERHGFLVAQKADLEDSLDKLSRAIHRINRTSKARFLETFEQVNERFQKIFPRMFNGGKASLALTDPSQPLETGVEIFAQPPGKKLQSVNLLSGGEKALTAVSLLFGIFLVRPTPFCLLDEVDAPLDDNNVGRYNAVVMEMAKRSQFILITHNKTTMEIGDTLYGVTMEEPGCSKLVSVRLREDDGEPERARESEAA